MQGNPPSAPVRPVPVPAPTINTSKGMESRVEPSCCKPEHRSPEAALSHVRKTCNGGKVGAGKC